MGVRDNPEDGALAALCEQEWPRLVGLLSLVTGDADAAEDLAQETLARLCRDWHKVRAYEIPSAWTYRVAINLAMSHGRRRAVRRRAMPSLRATSRDETEAAVDDGVVVRAAVAALPPRQRAVLALRYFADLSVNETAAIMGCPQGTVKRLTAEAIRDLRRDRTFAHDVAVPSEEGRDDD